jgi:hypothetical protein
MGVRNFLTGRISRILLAFYFVLSPVAAKAQSRYRPYSYNLNSESESKLDVGLEAYFGKSKWRIKSPNKDHSLTIPGTDEVQHLEISETVDSSMWGIAPYIGYSSEDHSWLDIKVGREFNRYTSGDDEIKGDDSYLLLGIPRHSGWGDWIYQGVYGEVDTQNILFIDKTVLELGGENGRGSLSLIVKWDKFNIKYTSFKTLELPYGDEWSAPVSDIITETEYLGKRHEITTTMGMRARFTQGSEDMRFSVFFDILRPVGSNDYIEPKSEWRGGIEYCGRF